MRSRDGGASFGPARRVGAGPGRADAPRLLLDAGGDLHLVYAETPPERGAQPAIRHARSAGGVEPFSPPRTISNPIPGPAGGAAYPALGIDGHNNLYVILEVLGAAGRARSFQIAVAPSGQGFGRPAPVPGSAAVPGTEASNGSHQGLLGKKLAVDEAGRLAIVNSSMLPG